MTSRDFDLCEDGARECRPSAKHRDERHRHAHPRHRRAARAGPRLQRLQLRRRRRRARHDEGGPALPLPRQGRAGPGADRALHASASPRRWPTSTSASPTRPPSSTPTPSLYADVLRDQRMCLCGMLAAEYQTLPDPMRDAVIAFIDANEAWVEKVLAEGQRAGTIALAGRPATPRASSSAASRARCSSRAPTATSRASTPPPPGCWRASARHCRPGGDPPAGGPALVAVAGVLGRTHLVAAP